MASRPRMQQCIFCGREFGSSSLEIHMRQCVRKWEMEQMQLHEARFPRGLPKGDARFPTADCPRCGGRFQVPVMGDHIFDCLSGRLQQQAPPPALSKPATGRNQASSSSASVSAPSSSSNRPPSAPAKRPGGPQAPPSVPYQVSAPLNLQPCKFCQRKFSADRVLVHERACINKPSKANPRGKRKQYDSLKHRLADTEMAANVEKIRKQTMQAAAKKTVASVASASSSSGRPFQQQQGKLPKWKAQSLAFRQAIREAKQWTAVEEYEKQQRGRGSGPAMRGGSRSISSGRFGGGGPPPLPPAPRPSDNPDYVQCPHCKRKFAPQPAERHIPACKNTINKPKPPPAASSASAMYPSSNSRSSMHSAAAPSYHPAAASSVIRPRSLSQGPPQPLQRQPSMMQSLDDGQGYNNGGYSSYRASSGSSSYRQAPAASGPGRPVQMGSQPARSSSITRATSGAAAPRISTRPW